MKLKTNACDYKTMVKCKKKCFRKKLYALNRNFYSFLTKTTPVQL